MSGRYAERSKNAVSDTGSTESSLAAVAAKPAAGTKANCPRCDQPGQPVVLQTLKQQVKPEHLETAEVGAFNFCRTPTCDVVYFNATGLMLNKADVRVRVG